MGEVAVFTYSLFSPWSLTSALQQKAYVCRRNAKQKLSVWAMPSMMSSNLLDH